MPVYAIGDRVPEIHESAYIHPEATIIGSAVIGPDASVWPQAVIRADDNIISIGEGSSIQDGAVIHCTPAHPTTVGKFVTVGHLAHLEGCTVHDHALVGTGSVVLHDAVIGEHALVGRGGDGARQRRGAALCDGARRAGEDPGETRCPSITPGMNVDTYIARGRLFAAELRRID